MAEQDVTKAIKAALESDREINIREYPIGIDQAGEAIELSGAVAHIGAKRKAVRRAQQAAGGTPVADRLMIRTSADWAGDALRDLCLQALNEEPALNELRIDAAPMDVADTASGWITVAVDGHRVTLEGRVGSVSHQRLAEVTAWWVPGCGDVVNGLEVTPPQTDGDGEIADALRLVLEKDRRLEPGSVQAAVQDRRVTLTGAVGSEPLRLAAYCDAWYVRGVEDVDNQLVIRDRADVT